MSRRLPRFRALLLAAVLSTGCSEDTATPDPADAPAEFAGSQACAPCHEQINANWEASGHPYALIAVGDSAPTDSYHDLAVFPADPPSPPTPYQWSDITYVAGGYGWKMLWINLLGYPVRSMTVDHRVLYSFADETWDFWGSYLGIGDPADCGACHATGWVPDEDWATDGDLSDNQGGLEGMGGSFIAPGIHCEECHGLGSRHAAAPERFDLIVDRTSADCGRCHHKDPQNDPRATGGFITANSQYDEWLHSGHALAGAVVECVDCHDPHASVKYDASAPGEGTFASCEGCHPEAAAINRHDAFAIIACVDCHMPYAVRSAYSQHFYRADMRTHLVDIATDPADRQDGMGMIDGTTHITQDILGRARITLDLACYGCHRDPGGIGGEDSIVDLIRLANFATGIHQAAPMVSDLQP